MYFQHAQRKTVIEKFRLESPEIIIIIIIIKISLLWFSNPVGLNYIFV